MTETPLAHPDAVERTPSVVLACLPAGEGPGPTAAEVVARLSGSSLGAVRTQPAPDKTADDGAFELLLAVPDGAAGAVSMRLWAAPAPALAAFQFGGFTLTDRERAAAPGCRTALGCRTQLGAEPLRDFHRQLRVLTAAAPDAAVVVDQTGYSVHGGDWVRVVAGTPVPPPPEVLWGLHAVTPDEGAPGGCWLHTHGLGRCGVAELELLDVPVEAGGVCARLLNSVAAMFVEHGMPPPGETFEVGRDLPLIWLPWEEALQHLPARCLGAEGARDQGHAGASAVLLAPRRWLFWTRYRSGATYAATLAENPLLYVSSMETERMALLARENLPLFEDLFRRFGAGEDWRFAVKLGFTVDGAEEPTQREHLWFEVHGLEGSRCDATLMNEPYGVRALKAGARAVQDLGRLSDWQIFSPHGRFGPDTVSLLRARLEQPTVEPR